MMTTNSNDSADTTRNADDEDAAMRQGFESATDDRPAQPAEAAKPDDEPGKAATGTESSQPDKSAAAPDPKGSTPGDSSDAPVDPFASLPQEVRSLLAKVPAMEAELADSSRRNRYLDGQVRSMQSRLDRADSQRTAQPKPDETAQPHKAAGRLPKLERVRETLGADLPEVMDALDELAGLLPGEANKASDPQPARADTRQQPEPGQDSIDPVVKAHLSTVDSLRDGWFQRLESDDARLWFATNREIFQRYSVADTAPKLIAVIDAYDAHLARVQQSRDSAATRTARMAAGVQPHGQTRMPARNVPMTEEEAMNHGFNS